MSENVRRAQLLADVAFEILMWDPRGDGSYEERPITQREQERAERLSRLSQAYGILSVTTGERPAQTGDTTGDTTRQTGTRGNERGA